MSEKAVGTRAQVWHGTARHTSGGLTKSNLLRNKRGRIVSRRRHTLAKRKNVLKKAGYIPCKGSFHLFRQSDGFKYRRGPRGTRKKRGGGSGKYRGGMAYGGPLAPHSFNGKGVGTSGVDLQFVAGNGN